MGVCEVCGNEYDKTMDVIVGVSTDYGPREIGRNYGAPDGNSIGCRRHLHRASCASIAEVVMDGRKERNRCREHLHFGRRSAIGW